MRLLSGLFLCVWLMGCSHATTPVVATYSIVAYDPAAGEWGVAVQSKFIAVGAVVPWARAEVGAIATQAFANTTYGPEGLKMLAEGMTAEQVIEKLTAADAQKDLRQIGIVDAAGRAATYTGARCMEWAGGKTGKGYAVQGNILAGPGVIEAMAAGYEKAEGDLGERLIAALEAGEAAGGDRRGRQSAALLIVKKNGGYAGLNDRYRDLRVDDHPQPIEELRRIYRLHREVFPAGRK